jgi:hypothetical protein
VVERVKKIHCKFYDAACIDIWTLLLTFNSSFWVFRGCVVRSVWMLLELFWLFFFFFFSFIAKECNKPARSFWKCNFTVKISSHYLPLLGIAISVLVLFCIVFPSCLKNRIQNPKFLWCCNLICGLAIAFSQTSASLILLPSWAILPLGGSVYMFVNLVTLLANLLLISYLALTQSSMEHVVAVVLCINIHTCIYMIC